MTFEQLLARLLGEIRRRIENGQLTERGLARLTRISQPHVHHVLSGKRGITPEVADRFMTALGLDLNDLMQETSTAKAGVRPQPDLERCVLLPLWEGLVAPGLPPPRPRDGGLYFPFPVALLGLDAQDCVTDCTPPRFAMVRLGKDPLLGNSAHENDLLVISSVNDGEADPVPLSRAAIWMLDGSWVLDALSMNSVKDHEPHAQAVERSRTLRSHGVMVANVHWLVRRLRAISVTG